MNIAAVSCIRPMHPTRVGGLGAAEDEMQLFRNHHEGDNDNRNSNSNLEKGLLQEGNDDRS